MERLLGVIVEGGTEKRWVIKGGRKKKKRYREEGEGQQGHHDPGE